MVPAFEVLWYQMDLNYPWEPSFPMCYDHSTSDVTGATDIEARNPKKKPNIDVIVSVATLYATDNTGVTARNGTRDTPLGRWQGSEVITP